MKVNQILKENQLDEIVNLSRFFHPQRSDIQIQEDILKLMNMLDAAKRGLRLANRLRDPPDKKKHLSIVFTNLNKIRAMLAKTLKVM